MSLSALLDNLTRKCAMLDEALLNIGEVDGMGARGCYYHDKVLPCMRELRAVSDEMECLMGKDYWPMPDYGDLLFSV